MNERKQIDSIREEYSGLRDLPRESLASSVKTLADDLYSKDTHFIFELIQNAEDNEYKERIRSRLRFEICRERVEGDECAVLAVHNNEIGFLDKHVRALCQVGRSTKSKAQGYIGEKGIGFKSVFRITTCPYVFSNGFQFRLPEQDEGTGLGYIVPQWVEKKPKGMGEGETTIVLPINKSEKDVGVVCAALQDIAPETILFLQKLSCLEISINLPNVSYEVVVEKTVLRSNGSSKLVELSYLRRDRDSEEEVIETSHYWLTEIEFQKPEEIQHEKRVGIASRSVTVAIPLGQQGGHEGKLFAYLPVWEKTGIPFLINADFLLVSSREGLREDEDWNKWLRDCVTEAYTEAFSALLSDTELPFKTKISAYASIPLSSHQQFLEPVVEAVQERLAELACVLASQDDEGVLPSTARLADESFRELLGGNDDLPINLRGKIRLVCRELEGFSEQLEAIGVQSLHQSDVVTCLENTAWVQGHSLPWFAELFRYLSKHDFDHDLHSLSIIPVEHWVEDGCRFSCDEDQPIYFPLEAQEKRAFADVPPWTKALVGLAFIHPEFWVVLQQQGDHAELTDWLTKELSVYPFTMKNYAVDLLAKLSDRYAAMEGEQLVEVAKYLFTHGDMQTNDWENLPIILADGQKMLLREARELRVTGSDEKIQAIVVPETFDQVAGWKYIWPEEFDRAHFVALADVYGSMPEQWFRSLNIQQYPGVRRVKYQRWNVPQEYSLEEDLGYACYKEAASSRKSEIFIESFIVPTSLSNGAETKFLSQALIGFLAVSSVKGDFQATGHYQNRGGYRITSPSSLGFALGHRRWFPTTKGLVAPSETFVDNQSIREVLGNSVPYFTGRLPDAALKMLRVNSEVTVDALLGLLKSNSGREKVSSNMLDRIYSELSNRSVRSSEILGAFQKDPLIFVKNGNGGRQWYMPHECVWEDAADALGADFVYLEKLYPKLKEFFVQIIKVKAHPDAECFARLWLKLQDVPLPDHERQRGLVKQIYRKLKPEVLKGKADRSAWCEGFFREAKLYSQHDVFVPPDELIWPDDGELQKIFRGHEDVQFAWKPTHDAYTDWEAFCKAFDVPLLSESISECLDEEVDLQHLSATRYVTSSTVKMIAACLRETRESDYQQLLDDGVFQELLSLKEVCVEDSIKVEFKLETTAFDYGSKVESYPVFWERADNNALIYQKNVEPFQVAKVLVRNLLAKHKSLEDSIELWLGATTTDRLKVKNWSVPREINELCGNIQKDQEAADQLVLPQDQEGASVSSQKQEVRSTAETHPAAPPVKGDDICNAATGLAKPMSICANSSPSSLALASDDEDGETGVHHEVDSPSCPSENSLPVSEETAERSSNTEDASATKTEPNYTKGLAASFNKFGKTELTEKGENLGGVTVKNPDFRGNRLAGTYRENIADEPLHEERRRITERSILEGPNESVRSSLYEWYRGKCQICEETWPKQNGAAFYVAAYLVDRRHARWLDEPGNAICLCAKHFAQWRLAAKEDDENVIAQIEMLRLKAEGGDGDLCIRFKMLGENCAISYDERHLLALRKLLEVAK